MVEWLNRGIGSGFGVSPANCWLCVDSFAGETPGGNRRDACSTSELGGEPVEEAGVRGRGTLGAEIVFGFDQAASEVLLPNAVDGDAGEEGVGWVNEPVGEVEAVWKRGSVGA